MARIPQPNVLFVNIGWAEKYDGNHLISGNQEDVIGKKGDPSRLSEGKAFLPDNGSVKCGAGIGNVRPDASIDLVFVARNPKTHKHEMVGIYFEPDFKYHVWTNTKGNPFIWADAYIAPTSFLELLGSKRPSIEWPSGRSLRRWVRKLGTIRFPDLYKQYLALI